MLVSTTLIFGPLKKCTPVLFPGPGVVVGLELYYSVLARCLQLLQPNVAVAYGVTVILKSQRRVPGRLGITEFGRRRHLDVLRGWRCRTKTPLARRRSCSPVRSFRAPNTLFK